MPRRIALAVLTAALLISAPAAAETPPPALGADALWVWSWDDQDELAQVGVADVMSGVAQPHLGASQRLARPPSLGPRQPRDCDAQAGQRCRR